MTKETPSDLLAKGHQQWQRKFSVFASQWTQPQLMKLAELALGETCLIAARFMASVLASSRNRAQRC